MAVCIWYHNNIYLWNGENYDILFKLNTGNEKKIVDIGFTEDNDYAVCIYEDDSACKIKLLSDNRELMEYGKKIISDWLIP